jgi:hypothetical protein
MKMIKLNTVSNTNLLRTLATAGVLAFMALNPMTAKAATGANVATNIPVLVMGEDEDPTSVKRSSDIFKRVLAELKGSMQTHGFQMIDEESVAVDLGWKMTERRPKMELIEGIKLMNRSGNASHQVRAWVLFRIHAQAKDLGFGTKVQTRIDGEIYDSVSNQFLDTFEMPRETYPAPANCAKSQVCINEVVGDRAREIALSLGNILAKKLERYSPPGQTTKATEGSVTGDSKVSTEDGHGLLTPYTVTLRRFDNSEALTVVGIMSEEFPGYHSHNLLKKASGLRRYEYRTTAKAYKMEEWLYILLTDMGFDLDKDLEVNITGTEIIIDKLVPTPSRPKSEDEKRRFD